MPVPIFFNFIQRIQVAFVGPMCRGLGRSFYKYGISIAGNAHTNSILTPKQNKITSNSGTPELKKFAFIGTNAHISGAVNSRSYCQIYFGSILKSVGEKSSIELGKEVLILDLVTVLADNEQQVVIGNESIISPRAYLHNCTIGNNAFVGANSKVTEGCKIEDFGGVAAGAYLLPHSKVNSREFWAGIPAQFLRNITEEEYEYMKDLRANYLKLGEIYSEELSKSVGAVLAEKNELISRDNPDEIFMVDLQDTSFHELLQEEKYPMGEADRNIETNRKNYSWYLQESSEGPKKDMLYDGLNSKFPGHLNQQNEGHQVANELKDRLENDSKTQTIKNEDFMKERIQVSDEEFKRKF